MKLFEWLGFETRRDSDKEGHEFAMRRTGGDPDWLHAMGVFKEYTREDAHRAAVRDGTVSELFPSENVAIYHESLQAPELRPQISHVKIIMTETVEVRPVTLFDQDKDVI